MPYILQENRPLLDAQMQLILETAPRDASSFGRQCLQPLMLHCQRIMGEQSASGDTILDCYIAHHRDNEPMDILLTLLSRTAGDYNYCLSYLLHCWLLRQGVFPIKYSQWNTAMGLLAQTWHEVEAIFKQVGCTNSVQVRGLYRCMSLEVYHACIAPYEDKKRLENGSVSKIDDLSQEKLR